MQSKSDENLSELTRVYTLDYSLRLKQSALSTISNK